MTTAYLLVYAIVVHLSGVSFTLEEPTMVFQREKDCLAWAADRTEVPENVTVTCRPITVILETKR